MTKVIDSGDTALVKGAEGETGGSLRFEVSEQPEDREWDDFLAATPGGHHSQSSLWARVKSQLGWSQVRVKAYQGEQLVGGAQLLIKSVRWAGRVAYLPKGPVLKAAFQAATASLIRQVQAVARSHGVRYLLCQPPGGSADAVELLEKHRFHVSPIEAFPVATYRLPLDQPTSDIMAKLKSKMRYNIRLAERKGVRVRRGTHADVPSFHECLAQTAERKGFSVYPLDHYEHLYEVFAASGHAEIFLAEYEGQTISALLLIPFGEVALFSRGGWTGQSSNLHSNEAMHWAAICWAQENNYRYYDFEEVNFEAAKAFIAGEKLPSDQLDSTSRFKFGFAGGEVQLQPDTYGCAFGPLLRLAHDHVYAPLTNIPAVNAYLLARKRS